MYFVRKQFEFQLSVTILRDMSFSNDPNRCLTTLLSQLHSEAV